MIKVNVAWLRENSNQLDQLIRRLEETIERILVIQKQLWHSSQGFELPVERLGTLSRKLDEQYEALCRMQKVLCEIADQYEVCEKQVQKGKATTLQRRKSHQKRSGYIPPPRRLPVYGGFRWGYPDRGSVIEVEQISKLYYDLQLDQILLGKTDDTQEL